MGRRRGEGSVDTGRPTSSPRRRSPALARCRNHAQAPAGRARARGGTSPPSPPTPPRRVDRRVVIAGGPSGRCKVTSAGWTEQRRRMKEGYVPIATAGTTVHGAFHLGLPGDPNTWEGDSNAWEGEVRSTLLESEAQRWVLRVEGGYPFRARRSRARPLRTHRDDRDGCAGRGSSAWNACTPERSRGGRRQRRPHLCGG